MALATVYLLRPRVRVLAHVGRWSLQHYLAHLVLVYWPLTIQWPEEDWSWSVGAGVAAGYSAVAILVAWCRMPSRYLRGGRSG